MTYEKNTNQKIFFKTELEVQIVYSLHLSTYNSLFRLPIKLNNFESK
jgi:hypothetical protein